MAVPNVARGVGKELDVTFARRYGPFSDDELPEQDSGSPQDERHDPGRGDHKAGHLGGFCVWDNSGVWSHRSIGQS